MERITTTVIKLEASEVNQAIINHVVKNAKVKDFESSFVTPTDNDTLPDVEVTFRHKAKAV